MTRRVRKAQKGERGGRTFGETLHLKCNSNKEGNIMFAFGRDGDDVAIVYYNIETANGTTAGKNSVLSVHISLKKLRLL